MTQSPALARAVADSIEASRSNGLNAVLSFDRETFLASGEVGAGVAGSLAGAAVAVKDNICTLEYPTTCGSRLLEEYRSPYDATAIERLKEAGAIVACKTNLDEFAMGSSTEYSAFGRTKHPLDGDRVPGGSSGGSAALVAAGAVEYALGSDTGGSVRQPAAFCGVVGVKPTYGRVSRYGLVAFGSSLDQIGVFGKTVGHTAELLCAISGYDPLDSTSAKRDPLQLSLFPRDLSGLTIGVSREYFPPNLDAGIRTACERVLEQFKQAGAMVQEVSLPHTHLAVATYYVIAPAEASSNLARFDGVRYGLRVEGDGTDVRSLYLATRGEGFGPEVRRRIVVGTYVLSSGYYEAYYRKAQIARSLIASDFDHVFAAGIDLLFTPTTPSVAFRAGEHVRDPVSMYLSDAFVCPSNLAGLPAVSVPIGERGGLPVGGQLIAPAFEEAKMLGAAHILESMVDASGEVL